MGQRLGGRKEDEGEEQGAREWRDELKNQQDHVIY